MKKLLSSLILSASLIFTFCLPVYASYIVPNGSITTVKIANDAVTTAKIPDQAVAPAKLSNRASANPAPLGGFAITSSFSFSTSSGPYVGVSGTGLTLTTKGNPVVVGIIPDGANAGSITSTANSNLRFLRNSSPVGEAQMGAIKTPPAAFTIIDFPAAGTQVYGLEASTAGNVVLTNCKFFAYEIL